MGSCVDVNTHPYLYSSLISVSMECNCPDGKEVCAEICSQDAIVFLTKNDATARMKNKEWLPGAIVDSTKTV